MDITERKRVEEKLAEYQKQLKSLASQLSLTQEREKHRLATKLHDQISQALVVSKIKLDELRKSTPSGELSQILDDLSNCLEQLIDDSGTLMFEMSSPILHELGFEAAVSSWLVNEIQKKHAIKTEFEDDGQPKPLNKDVRALLFRSVRELLLNVIKHAQAQTVTVSIARIEGQIRIRVEDDGIGFDPVAVTAMAARRAEYGLFSIQEGLEQLDGQISIESEPECGSKIVLMAPLKEAAGRF
jgi:signal transduction histidine kinase